MTRSLLYILLLFLAISGCYLFEKSSLLPEKFVEPNQSWISETLQKMSLDQKIGQLFIIDAGTPFNSLLDPEYIKIKNLVQRYHVGGIVINSGDAHQNLPFINEFQIIARIPLFIIGDFEKNTGRQFKGGTNFIPPLGIAASGDMQNAYDIGRITATEARAMGYHLILCPTANIADNLSDKDLFSYGQDPAIVSSFTSAYVRGLQDHGLMAGIRNFPGKMNLIRTTELELPANLMSFQELQQTGLMPFVEAIKNNVSAIITANVAYPNYDQGFKHPATFSPYILTNLLKERYNFEGLILSDYLDETIISENYYPGYAAVRALMAGVDLILLSANEKAAFQAIREAVQDKKISMQRIDESVRKILYWKSVLGLDEVPLLENKSLTSKVRLTGSLKKAQDIADQAVTVIRNQDLPLSDLSRRKILVTGFFAEEQMNLTDDVFCNTLDLYCSEVDMQRANQYLIDSDSMSILNKARNADILINTFIFNRGQKLTRKQFNLLQLLQNSGKPVLNVVFGSPYLCTAFPNVHNIIIAYSDLPDCQRAAAKAIAGAISIKGKLPVALPEIAPFKSGENIPETEEILALTDYKTVLKKPEYIDSLRLYLKESIQNKAFPGCAISAGYKGHIVLQEAFGNFTYEPQSISVKTNSIFDLASLTKVVSATTIAMIFYEQGLLNLNWKVAEIIPDFRGNDKEQVTVYHLLTHTSGLPGWSKFYMNLKGKELIIKEICATDLINQPGSKTVYSDLGMILIQKILETISQKPLDMLVSEYITGPLSMERTFYNPDPKFRNEILPTEISEFHNKLVHGFVHDENTFAMGGVSGHAGLFSTVEDLSIFCQMYLNGGIYNHKRILRPETVRMFTTRQNLVKESTRAIGWDTRSEEESMTGNYMSENAFGHSGFTGTTLWLDPDYDLFVVFLTNRVHPTRENNKIKVVRPKVHDFIMRAVLNIDIQ